MSYTVGALEVEEIHSVGTLWECSLLHQLVMELKVRLNTGTVPTEATKLGRSSRIFLNRSETAGP